MSANSVDAAVARIRALIPGARPRVAIVCGSGLGGVADLVEEAVSIAYTELPGFPVPTVAGHAGKLVVGQLSGVSVICLRGRVHLYEGGGFDPLKVMIRSLRNLGIEILVLTNSAGSLRTEIGAGELVVTRDHVNLTGTSPLIGPNDDRFGPRFVDLTDCWDPDLRALAHDAAREEGLRLNEGVFAGWMGPAFETAAEIRMMQILGCDTVGMSMVAENLIARHCGLPVLGVSVITNLACGLTQEPLSHEQTLAMARRGDENLTRLLVRLLRKLPRQGP